MVASWVLSWKAQFGSENLRLRSLGFRATVRLGRWEATKCRHYMDVLFDISLENEM